MKVFLLLLLMASTLQGQGVVGEIFSRQPIPTGRQINHVLKSPVESQQAIDSFLQEGNNRRGIFSPTQHRSAINFLIQSEVSEIEIEYEEYDVAGLMSQRNLERLYDISYDADGSPVLIWKETGAIVPSSDDYCPLIDDVLRDGDASTIPQIVERIKAKRETQHHIATTSSGSIV